MKAMILAAGLGKRMRPLTDHKPKPLIEVRGKPLIEWHLERIACAGMTEVIINISYLGHMIRDHIGDGSSWGLNVVYSEEPEPLETGGAIVHAAKLLGREPFVLINADIFTDYDLAPLVRHRLPAGEQGHLVLVPNPDFKPQGDFGIQEGKLVPLDDSCSGYTFAGISLLTPELVLAYPANTAAFGLAEVFRSAMVSKRLGAEVYLGAWSDVGTVERLRALVARDSAQKL
ncbi:N-acetylmuramate alpha-1-phosphate uridylyltransferase MurU [Gilvimarinus xylanilyticus]|uniref:Nucleotidyltransferase family protein n=1 Tax=Gilvimarinus xylanilyticus TaxID=2944139 RepID=A0A9X2I251_9GAMM|nr:nucleotidyltransferase family protein [Gilvimarinus xylanilyticus]MCP8899378.1 nucleotidyltransferase family protein [Gilvimarinus xylanilyticus]